MKIVYILAVFRHFHMHGKNNVLSELNSFRESPLFHEALEAKRRHGSELERAVARLLLALVQGRCIACGGSAAYVEQEGRLLIFCDTCGVTLKQSFRRDGGGGGASS
jgi:hypothetical protein